MASHVRLDGRKTTETRPIAISFDKLARADGSARFSFGETTALASFSGPIEVRLASELPSKATFEVHLRPLSGVSAADAKSLSSAIRSSLEPSLFLNKAPRTLAQLVIQSLSPSRGASWGDSLSAAVINASSLAIVNAASIPMRGIVCAVAIGSLSDGTLVLDPTDAETAKLRGTGCFAFMFADDIGEAGTEIDCVWTSWRSIVGGYDEKELLRAKEVARVGARTVYSAIKKSIQGAILGVGTAEQTRDEIMKTDESESSDDDEKMII
ncbi:hypothetical protein NLJ89_g2025 [Agrocybe chaxingu]|uniref:Exoribonuclease phosphorolytic domain-containing protein n=1 Tax=Agrocybe chaxingu TaxID=84603 RepID=A0A9W8K586_9AGAR|nr:hypothetical protein NLJ89_g2025 [Agrocybe chaxingu]